MRHTLRAQPRERTDGDPEDSRPATLSELFLVRDQLNSRIDDLQKVMFWGFGLLAALLIALLGVVLSGAG